MNILFVVDNYFPHGTAYATRAYNLCNILGKLGHNIFVISSYSKDKDVELASYISSFEVASKSGPTAKDSLVCNKQLIKLIEHCLEKNDINLILTSSGNHVKKLLKISKNLELPVIIEVCEWFDKSNFTFGSIDPRYINNNILRKYVYTKASGIIAISTYLENYYKNYLPVIRIPTILDVNDNSQYDSDRDNKIKIVYTGNPGKSKELLLPIISLLAKNEKYREAIQFHIFGPSKKQVIENIGNNEELLVSAGSSVVINGKVDQSKIPMIIGNSDYQLFLRPSRRSSNAGFPTKLGESMAVGTPVITNSTGDISKYLHSGENGFLVDEVNTLECIFEKIVSIDENQYRQMRKNAYDTAKKHFNYESYINSVEEFLKKVCESES